MPNTLLLTVKDGNKQLIFLRSPGSIEANIWRQYGHLNDTLQLVPTVATFLAGWISVQPAGAPVAPSYASDAKQHPFWNAMLEEKDGSVTDALNQFVILESKLCLADYGSKDLLPFLRKHF